MKDEVKALLLFAGIGLALIAADRMYRITPLLQRERFQNPMSMIQRCGANLPGCPSGLKCFNGFCLSQDIPIMHETLMLPVVP